MSDAAVWILAGTIAISAFVVAAAVDGAMKQLSKISDTLNEIRYHLTRNE